MFSLLLISLVMVWMQMLLILTKSVNRCFQKNPKFDMTPLLGGTDAVFSSLIHSFSWLVPFLPFRIYTFVEVRKLCYEGGFLALDESKCSFLKLVEMKFWCPSRIEIMFGDLMHNLKFMC